MINDKMLAALNKQINAEIYSSYLYLGMSAYFSNLNLKGSADWMRLQSDEERDHAMKMYDFIISRGGKIDLMAIDSPPQKWQSPLKVFEAVLAHEQKVTSLINELVATAIKTQDYPSSSFLQWFVDEQVQEEATAEEIVQKLTMIGDSGPALLMLDQELGQRQNNPGRKA